MRSSKLTRGDASVISVLVVPALEQFVLTEKKEKGMIFRDDFKYSQQD